ncbi:hypothetical protein AB0M72_06845 [Nocardiopsis dassonvillei]
MPENAEFVCIDWAAFAQLPVKDRMKALDQAERDTVALLARVRYEIMATEVAEQAAAHGEHGSRRRAAEALGISPGRVGQLMKKHGRHHGGTVTPDQLRALWHGTINRLDRGPEYTLLTRLNVDALMRGTGVGAEDWDGENPAEHMWQVLAEVLSDSGHMEATDSHQTQALYRVSEATDGGYPRLDEAIKSALAVGCAVAEIAAEAGVDEGTVLALRDGI